MRAYHRSASGLSCNAHVHSHKAQPTVRSLIEECSEPIFFALDMDRDVDNITSGCTQCSSLRKSQHYIIEQTTPDLPDVVGITFAADVMYREKQLILVVRECLTSYTSACIIENELADTLRSCLV